MTHAASITRTLASESSFFARVKRSLADLLTSPGALRFAFAVLRQLAPVFVFGKRVIVTRHADVLDILSRDRDFSIAEINGDRTARDNGPFVLSLDPGPQHDREKDFLNRVMRRDDLGRIRSFVAEEGARSVEAARAAGRLELVAGLTRPVPLALIHSYFGVPARSEVEMMHWLKALFHDLFLNPGDDPQVIRDAVQSFQGLRPHLEQVIAERRTASAAGGATRDDVLGRMLELQGDAGHRAWLDDDAICRNISGLIIGALETTSKSVVHVIDELLRRPEALRGARAAALAGDMAKVRGYAFEALRFNPFAPIVVRFCAKGASVGSRFVPAGKTVFAVTTSAMFDSAAVEHPNDFRPDRSIEYLHFGHGLHRCQGHLVNGVQVPELAACVLRLKNLRRAPGKAGRVEYEGPFPERFSVEFDPD